MDADKAQFASAFDLMQHSGNNERNRAMQAAVSNVRRHLRLLRMTETSFGSVFIAKPATATLAGSVFAI